MRYQGDSQMSKGNLVQVDDKSYFLGNYRRPLSNTFHDHGVVLIEGQKRLPEAFS